MARTVATPPPCRAASDCAGADTASRPAVVSERTHPMARFLVELGITSSTFWMLGLTAWLRTPAGYAVVDVRASTRTSTTA